jgi:hypothetical protein
MDSTLFIESIDFEYRQIKMESDAEWKYLMDRFEAIQNEDPYMFEAKNDEKKSGGLVGVIGSMIQGIIKFLGSIGTKIKNLLLGEKTDEKGKENEQVKLDKDPNMLIKFINGDIKSSKDMLAKCQRGEVPLDEVKGFITKQNMNFDALKGTVLTLGGLFVSMGIMDKSIAKWKAEAEELYNSTKADGSNQIAHKASMHMTAEGQQAAIDEGTKLLVNHIRDTTAKGPKKAIEMAKILYQRNYLRQRSEEDLQAYRDPKMARTLKKREKEQLKNQKKMKRQEEKFVGKDGKGGTREKTKNKQNERMQKIDKATNELRETQNKGYVDSNQYVNK